MSKVLVSMSVLITQVVVTQLVLHAWSRPNVSAHDPVLEVLRRNSSLGSNKSWGDTVLSLPKCPLTVGHLPLSPVEEFTKISSRIAGARQHHKSHRVHLHLCVSSSLMSSLFTLAHVQLTLCSSHLKLAGFRRRSRTGPPAALSDFSPSRVLVLQLHVKRLLHFRFTGSLLEEPIALFPYPSCNFHSS
jgi:hypothetical protein